MAEQQCILRGNHSPNQAEGDDTPLLQHGIIHTLARVPAQPLHPVPLPPVDNGFGQCYTNVDPVILPQIAARRFNPSYIEYVYVDRSFHRYKHRTATKGFKIYGLAYLFKHLMYILSTHPLLLYCISYIYFSIYLLLRLLWRPLVRCCVCFRTIPRQVSLWNSNAASVLQHIDITNKY